MRLLIVRHADAGDSEEFAATGQPDHLRPLSRKGRRQMTDAARTLVRLVPEPAVLVSSPYTRAVQTAEIVRRAYGRRAPVETTPALEPEQEPRAFDKWLGERDADDVVVCFGHEPHLSALATWMLTGMDDSRVRLKKGAACLLELDGAARAGAATLQWLIGPRELRALGKR